MKFIASILIWMSWKPISSLEEGSRVEVKDGTVVSEPSKGCVCKPQVLWRYLSPLRSTNLKEKLP